MALSVRVFNKTTQISYRLIWHIMTPSLNTAGNSSQICRDFQKKMKLFSLKRKDFFHFRIINHKNDLNRVPVSHLRRKFSNEAKNKLQIVFSYIQFLVLNDSKLLTGDAQIWGGNKSWWCHDVTMSRCHACHGNLILHLTFLTYLDTTAHHLGHTSSSAI